MSATGPLRAHGSPTSHPCSGLGVALLAAATVVETTRRARTRRVTPGEERVFRRFNDGADHLEVPAWLIMQAGSLGAVAVVSLELGRRGRGRSAAVVGLTGTAVWWAVRAVKPSIGRGRPDDHLAAVRVRGRSQTGLGYPSGHAAVAATLAGLTVGAHGPVGVVAATASASVVGATRMYVGAHLPLDVAGGLAIGTLAGAAGRRFRRWAEP